MALSQAEFDAILADDSKRIIGDLAWYRIPEQPDAARLDAEIVSQGSLPLQVAGWFRPTQRKLSYSLLLEDRRIAGIDFGRNLSHRNQDGTRLVGAHWQFWSAAHERAEAYPLPAGTPTWDRPLEVWAQFCSRLGIMHEGAMSPPPLEELRQ